MREEIHPLWWPALLALSPLLAPLALYLTWRLHRTRAQVASDNAQRLANAAPLPLPILERLELTVLVDWRARKGFLGDAAVSYHFSSNRGDLLMDVGHGRDTPVLEHNLRSSGVDIRKLKGLAISHTHLDHAGDLAAQQTKHVSELSALGLACPMPCFVPEVCEAPGFHRQVVTEPGLLTAGWASTGPLARAMYFRGRVEEQALLARVEQGLVVVTGCGHPTIQLILQMVRQLSSEPIHAIVGGLHFPVTSSRSQRWGLPLQRVFSTGDLPHRRIDDRDLDAAIAALNEARPTRLLLSAHDSCDHALLRLQREVHAEVEVLEAGGRYLLAPYERLGGCGHLGSHPRHRHSGRAGTDPLKAQQPRHSGAGDAIEHQGLEVPVGQVDDGVGGAADEGRASGQHHVHRADQELGRAATVADPHSRHRRLNPVRVRIDDTNPLGTEHLRDPSDDGRVEPDHPQTGPAEAAFQLLGQLPAASLGLVVLAVDGPDVAEQTPAHSVGRGQEAGAARVVVQVERQRLTDGR